ncbi:MAG: response regulator [Humidesulfovibrio sp.]|nr:response regulator [Humidesulfovibrio sp.]
MKTGAGHDTGHTPGRGRVLVVDDEMHLRLYIAAVFETAGYETATARDGDEGFRKASEWKPDLVSLDLMMPNQGGIRLFQRLKADEELKRAGVLVVSAIGGEAFRHSLSLVRTGSGGLLPDVDGYVEKPPAPEALLREAARILEARGAQAEGTLAQDVDAGL